MSSASKGGFIQGAIGSALLFAGLVVPGLQFLTPIGAGLLTSGVFTVAGSLLAKNADDGDDPRRSPTYGDFQFQNRSKGDSPLPVVYANDTASDTPGHKLAPVYVQAYATPKGYSEDDGPRGSGRGQELSCLLAVAEGPIEAIEDVRINDEPLYEVHTDESIGTGNGSKVKFEIPGRRIDVRSVEVKVDGTSKGWSASSRTELAFVGNGTGVFGTITLAEDDEEIDDGTDLIWFFGDAPTSSTQLSGAAGTMVVSSSQHVTDPPHPIAWLEGGRKTLFFTTQAPLATGQKLWVRIPVRKLTGITLEKADDGKFVKVKFATAPSSGAKVTASWRRKTFPNVRVETRLGSAHQLAIEGFEAIRNSVSVNQTLAKGTSVTQTTSEAVDDVVVLIQSTGNGFTAYDNKGGGNQAVAAQITIEWKHQSAADSAYVSLKDPAGPNENVSKSLSEFRLADDSIAQVTWSFSVRELLRRWADDHPSDQTAAAAVAAFTRDRYSIRVTRTNTVQQTTNALINDGIEWATYTKVLHERLNHPGTALLAIHAIGSDKLQGSLPRITCRVRGKRDVEAYSAGNWVASSTAQANPVWAAIDLITNERYGGGAHFTKAANIDTTSAVAAASWCDTNVTHDGTTEKRAVLDYVVDTRRQLMEHVRDMLGPAHVVPVLRGNVWHFEIDQAVTLSTVESVNDDGSSGHVLAESMTMQHAPVTSKITELQLSFLDREDDLQHAEVWFAPQVPTESRRIERATAYGVTRKSQATRYGAFLAEKLRQRGVSIGWAMSPQGLPIEVNDVVRVISSRLGIDLYARIVAWEIDSTETMAVKVQAEQYVPAVYGQDTSKQTIIAYKPPASVELSIPVAGPTRALLLANAKKAAKAKLRATVRRVA